MKHEILKKVYVNNDGDMIMASLDLHKKNNGFTFVQEKPETTWKIKNELNTTGVIVQVWDEDNRIIWPKTISIDSSESVTIEFSQKQSGRAFLIVNTLP